MDALHVSHIFASLGHCEGVEVSHFGTAVTFPGREEIVC